MTELTNVLTNVLTDKDKYTYVTLSWSTYEEKTYETDGDEYDGDENDTYEEDNHITKMVEIPHVVHFNVNLTPKELIDRVVSHYEEDLNEVIYFDEYASMELTEKFKKQLMYKYGIPKDLEWCFKIKLEKGQDRRIRG